MTEYKFIEDIADNGNGMFITDIGNFTPTGEYRIAKQGDWILDINTKEPVIYQWDEKESCNCPHFILKQTT